MPRVPSRIVVGLAVVLAISGCGGGSNTAPPTVTTSVQTAPIPLTYQYVIDVAAAAQDPEGYYQDLGRKLGMEYGPSQAVEDYFVLNNGLMAEIEKTDDQTAGQAQIENYLQEHIGRNLVTFAKVFYYNPDLPPVQVEAVIDTFGPYVFQLVWQDEGLREALRDWAKQLQETQRGLTLVATFNPDSYLRPEFLVAVYINADFGNGQFGNVAYVSNPDGHEMLFAPRPGFAPEGDERHLVLGRYLL